MQLFGKKVDSSTWSSHTRLVLGAAGLLLFIVGVKRTYRLEDATGTVLGDDPAGGAADAEGAEDAAPADGAERP